MNMHDFLNYSCDPDNPNVDSSGPVDSNGTTTTTTSTTTTTFVRDSDCDAVTRIYKVACDPGNSDGSSENTNNTSSNDNSTSGNTEYMSTNNDNNTFLDNNVTKRRKREVDDDDDDDNDSYDDFENESVDKDTNLDNIFATEFSSLK